MYRLSSNATLFFKIFLPVFWTTIMVAVNLVAWFSAESDVEAAAVQSMRWGLLFTLVVGVAAFLLLFWPLKRVETDGKEVFVSNYFRTAHYGWASDVEGIEVTRFLGLRICWLHLNGVGSFGQRIRFLGSRKLLEGFFEAYPELRMERPA